MAANLSAGPACPACASPANAGLCHSERCQREVLPQQKAPGWHREAHSGLYHELGQQRVDEMELSPAGRRAKARRARAAARLLDRVAGGPPRTRSRHRTGDWDDDVDDAHDVMTANRAIAAG
jgi:hypothetical protein